MENLWDSVLNTSIWAGGFTIVFILINKIFKNKLPLSCHYYIWLIVLVRLLLPFFITIDAEPTLYPYANQNITEATAYIPASPNVFNNSTTEEGTILQIENNINLQLAKVNSIGLHKDIFTSDNLWIIWLVVAVVIYLYKAVVYFLFKKTLLKYQVHLNEAEQQIFANQLSRFKIKNVSLFKSNNIQTPFAIGLLKPMIILPNRQYYETQLSHILSHELNHIKRCDIAIKWLFEVAKAIHWFNPFVYLAAQKAAFYCEASCDEAVLKNSSLNGRKEYSLTIIDVINQAVKAKISMSVSMNSGKSHLKERIMHILNDGRRKKNTAVFLVVALLALGLCACSSVKVVENSPTDNKLKNAELSVNINNKKETTSTPKAVTNLLVAGVDEAGNFADVIMIVSLNTTTNKINLLSVPRDTFLSPSDDTRLKLSQQGINIPTEIKFGQLINIAKVPNNMEYLQYEISQTLGIQTDYYIKMDMSAFESIVDCVGGVYMTIPDGGLFYSDPTQNLEIALQEGSQLLDGKKAIQYIRYRLTYDRGDMDRISVQQQFIKELYKKLLDGENLSEKLSTLLSIATAHTETNLTMNDLMLYLQFIPKITSDSIQTFILPGEVEVKRTDLPRYYFILNKNEFDETIADYFR